MPIKIEKWKIDSNSSSIMGQADLQTLEEDIGLMSTPDMVYDKNFLEFHGAEPRSHLETSRLAVLVNMVFVHLQQHR